LMASERGIVDLYWSLPLDRFEPLRSTATSDFFFDYLSRPVFDDTWAVSEIGDGCEAIRAPMLHIGGWYDTFAAFTRRLYERIARNGEAPQRLLMGPWFHMPWTQLTGELDFGSEARNLIDEYSAAWFDHWLPDEPEGEPELPPVRIFVMGINRWRDERGWPLERTAQERFYLTSRGSANSMGGDGRLADRPDEGADFDVFVYNPSDPVPSRGGKSCCWPETSPMGPKDERPVEVRNDVLCYTSAPLEHPLEVTGHVSALLCVSSSAPDTDFTIKLVDVHPC